MDAIWYSDLRARAPNPLEVYRIYSAILNKKTLKNIFCNVKMKYRKTLYTFMLDWIRLFWPYQVGLATLSYLGHHLGYMHMLLIWYLGSHGPFWYKSYMEESNKKWHQIIYVKVTISIIICVIHEYIYIYIHTSTMNHM